MIAGLNKGVMMKSRTSVNEHYISNETVQELNEVHGWFQYEDAQSDVSRAFANNAIHAFLNAAKEAEKAKHKTGLSPLQLVMQIEDMQARIDELSKDAARIDWIEQRTLINSKGTRSEGLKQDFDAKFVVMPSWYQHGKEFANLRDAIDDAKERAACNSSL